MSKPRDTNNLVVITDTHGGSRLSLVPPGGVDLDEGGRYMPSKLQLKMWAWWREFWDTFVPWATQGEPFAVVHLGDCIDGVHHGTVSQISHNLADQAEISRLVLEPVVEKAKRGYWHIRGTPAHVGASASEEERLARTLDAIPNEEGQYARFELYKTVGSALVHAAHHIGSTGSSAYEGTAVHKELIEAFIEAARWGQRPPDYILRGHRHRHYETKIMTARGQASGIVCPGWQAKTDFSFKIGMRMSPPQFGGLVVRQGKDKHYVLEFVKNLDRPKVE